MLIGKIILISLSLWSASPGYVSNGESSVLRTLNTESGNTLQISWNDDTKTPDLISGQLTKPSNHSPQWISLEFINKVKILYSLKRVNENMKVVNIDKSNSDSIKVYMQRQLYGKEVCGDHLIVTMNRSGVIQRVEGTIHSKLEAKRLNRPMYPAVSQNKAINIAKSHVALEPIETTEVRSCYLPTRAGIPLIHFVKLNQATIKVHSITGQIIE